MKRILLALVVSLCFPVFIGYAENPALPFGTFDYKVLVNDKEVGSASMKFEKVEGQYVVEAKMEMSISNGPNTVKIVQNQRAVETTNFVPVSYKATVIQIMGEAKQEMKIEATVKDKKMEINRDGNKTTVDLPPGVLISSSMKSASDILEKKFAPGTKLTYKVIEPAMGDTAEEAVVEVIGKEEIDVNGKKMKLNKITQTTKAMTMTLFCDDQGVAFSMQMQAGPISIKLVKK